MAKLLYQGHGSYRITTDEGLVLYVDPYVGEGYELPADLVLVTHGHDDHTAVHLVTQKPGCQVITFKEALEGGTYHTFQVGGVGIEAVEAYNVNHDPKICVGFVLTLDGLTVYAAGDTSTTEQMKELATRGLDYAILPGDGIYNMDLEEASQCARLLGAKHTIPVHLKPGELFDRARAQRLDCPSRLIVAPGEEITL